MKVTMEAIGAAVRQKITEGLPPTEAAQHVAEQFVGRANGKLRALLDAGILTRAFREIEYNTLLSQQPNPTPADNPRSCDGLNDGVAGAGDPHLPGPLSTNEPRTRYHFDGEMLDLVLPVTGTNRRKRLGDWVKEDTLAVYHTYRSRADSAKKVAALFKRVSLKIGDGTLGDVWWKLEDMDRRAIVGKSA